MLNIAHVLARTTNPDGSASAQLRWALIDGENSQLLPYPITDSEFLVRSRLIEQQRTTRLDATLKGE